MINFLYIQEEMLDDPDPLLVLICHSLSCACRNTYLRTKTINLLARIFQSAHAHTRINTHNLKCRNQRVGT